MYLAKRCVREYRHCSFECSELRKEGIAKTRKEFDQYNFVFHVPSPQFSRTSAALAKFVDRWLILCIESGLFAMSTLEIYIVRYGVEEAVSKEDHVWPPTKLAWLRYTYSGAAVLFLLYSFFTYKYFSPF